MTKRWSAAIHTDLGHGNFGLQYGEFAALSAEIVVPVPVLRVYSPVS
jgi:hypothetical protein